MNKTMILLGITALILTGLVQARVFVLDTPRQQGNFSGVLNVSGAIYSNNSLVCTEDNDLCLVNATTLNLTNITDIPAGVEITGSISMAQSGFYIGQGAQATQNYCTAIGYGASCTALWGVALGYQANSSNSLAVNIGHNTIKSNGASGQFSVAIGTNVDADENYCTAIGMGSGCSGQQGTSVGYLASSGFLSASLGASAVASHNESVALGYATDTTANDQVKMGDSAQPLDVDVDGSLTVRSDSLSTVAATIKGAVGQTADLQEWQNSGSTSIAKIDKDGNFYTNTIRLEDDGSDGLSFYDNTSATSFIPIRTNRVELRQGSTANRAAMINFNWWGMNSDSYIRFGSATDANGAADLSLFRNSTTGALQVGTGARSGRGVIDAGTVEANLAGITMEDYGIAGYSKIGGSDELVFSNADNAGRSYTFQGSAVTMATLTAFYPAYQTVYGGKFNQVYDGTDLYLQIYNISSSYAIKGAPGQTANIQEWKNSAGTEIAYVTASGDMVVADQLISKTALYLDSTGTTDILLRPNGNTRVWIKGDDASGRMGVGEIPSGSGQLHVTSLAATRKGITIKAAASQTANLTEWQNSSGAGIASINATGTAFLKGVYAAGYIQNETGRTMSIGSTDVYYNITNWTISHAEGFSGDAAEGKVTAIYNGDYKFDMSFSFSGGGGDTYHVVLAINGLENGACHGTRKLGTAGDVGNMGITCIITLNAGDYLHLWVEDEAVGASDINIYDFNANIMRIGGLI